MGNKRRLVWFLPDGFCPVDGYLKFDLEWLYDPFFPIANFSRINYPNDHLKVISIRWVGFELLNPDSFSLGFSQILRWIAICKGQVDGALFLSS